MFQININSIIKYKFGWIFFYSVHSVIISCFKLENLFFIFFSFQLIMICIAVDRSVGLHTNGERIPWESNSGPLTPQRPFRPVPNRGRSLVKSVAPVQSDPMGIEPRTLIPEAAPNRGPSLVKSVAPC